MLKQQVVDNINHTEAINDLMFSVDNRYILVASCGQEGGLTIWDLEAKHAETKSLSSACSLTHLPKVSRVLVGYQLLEFDLSTRQIVERSFNMGQFDAGSLSYGFSPNGNIIATEAGGQLVLRDIATGTDLIWDDWRNYQSNIVGLAWSSQNILALVDENGLVILWDMNKYTPIGKVIAETYDVVSHPLVFSPNGSFLVTVFSGSPAVWSVVP